MSDRTNKDKSRLLGDAWMNVQKVKEIKRGLLNIPDADKEKLNSNIRIMKRVQDDLNRLMFPESYEEQDQEDKPSDTCNCRYCEGENSLGQLEGNIEYMRHRAQEFLDKYGMPPYVDDIALEEEEIKQWMVMFAYEVIPYLCHPKDKTAAELSNELGSNTFDVLQFKEFYEDRLDADEGLDIDDMSLDDLKAQEDKAWDEGDWEKVQMYMQEIMKRTMKGKEDEYVGR